MFTACHKHIETMGQAVRLKYWLGRRCITLHLCFHLHITGFLTNFNVTVLPRLTYVQYSPEQKTNY